MGVRWKGGRTIRIEVATSYTVGTIEERQFVSDRMDERVHNIIMYIYIYIIRNIQKDDVIT